MKKAIFAIVIIFSQIALFGQNKTNRPYSIFGIGELTSKGLGRNIAMGKTGIALSSDNCLNNVNPASNYLLDSISFFFDMGLAGDFVKYETKDLEQYGSDININNLAIGFRAAHFWTCGIGVAPFSTVGYKIFSENYVDGNTDKYYVESSGSGGLNQFYWDNSLELFKNFNIGIDISYVFGNIQSEEINYYTTIESELDYTETSYFNKLIVDYGFQYRNTINDNIKFTIGGIFGSNHQLNYQQKIDIINYVSGDVVENKESETGAFTLPLHVGGGFAINYVNKITITGDYIFENWDATDNWEEEYIWNDLSTENRSYKFSNANKYRFGIEYVPGGNLVTNNYLGIMRYRAGFYHEQSYLTLGKNQIRDMGITLGVSLPFLRNRTSLNIAWMSGIFGTTEDGLIRERYNTVHLSLELHDWWFRKAQYD